MELFVKFKLFVIYLCILRFNILNLYTTSNISNNFALNNFIII